MSVFIFILCVVNVFALNMVTFNTTNVNQDAIYVCPMNDDCQIICEGNEVCRGSTFVCPTNNDCNIRCTPDINGEGPINRNACTNSTVIAIYTPSLILECRNYGCYNMVINMTHGGDLKIFEQYIGYSGTQTETNGMTGMVVYGEYLDSFSMECYLPQSCNYVTLYLNYTKSINIIADSKNVKPTSTSHTHWIFRYSQVYASNAGDIYLYCGWIGCIESKPLIDARNANSLNLTCNGYFACAADDIYCPNNGPRGGYSTSINVDFTELNPFYDNTVYAVEQFEDVTFNCMANCDTTMNNKLNKLKCNPNYDSECVLTTELHATDVHCYVQTILNPPECSYYLLPTGKPTVSPTIAPSISTQIPTMPPTQSSLLPTLTPSQIPTQIPSKITSNPTLTPTLLPSNIPSKTPTNNPSKTPTNTLDTSILDNMNIQHRNRLVIILCCCLALALVLLFGVCIISKLCIESRKSLNNPEIELHEHIPHNSMDINGEIEMDDDDDDETQITMDE